MAVHALYILSKAGGLIYQRDFTAELKRFSANEYLVLAGTFHSVHALSTRVSPLAKSSGIQVIETNRLSIHCLQTLTGLKFLLFTDLKQASTPALMSHVYELFADYVMKNPFYQLDMPIRSTLFDRHLTAFLG